MLLDGNTCVVEKPGCNSLKIEKYTGPQICICKTIIIIFFKVFIQKYLITFVPFQKEHIEPLPEMMLITEVPPPIHEEQVFVCS